MEEKIPVNENSLSIPVDVRNINDSILLHFFRISSVVEMGVSNKQGLVQERRNFFKSGRNRLSSTT